MPTQYYGNKNNSQPSKNTCSNQAITTGKIFLGMTDIPKSPLLIGRSPSSNGRKPTLIGHPLARQQ